MKIVTTLLIGSVLLWAVIRTIASRATPPVVLGLQQGRLAPCPDRPNCTESRNKNEPIAYTGKRDAAHARLINVVGKLPRVRVEGSTPDYIHAVTHSCVFGFIDDLEFYLPESAGIIHYRSAARSGHSDLGVNRTRMDVITARFSEEDPE